MNERPIAPHIPEAPTEADVRRVLGYLTFGICYYKLGDRQLLNETFNAPGSTSYKIEPVMGVMWQAPEADAVTVYIEGKPFAVPTDWLPKPMGNGLGEFTDFMGRMKQEVIG